METYCQSCGMPMQQEQDLRGINADGSKNEDYCVYCFENGKFTCECTMEEMADQCVQFMVEERPELKPDQARQTLEDQFKTLKRWRTT